MSTNVSPKYLRSNFMAIVRDTSHPSDDSESHKIEMTDLFDNRRLSLMRSITQSKPVIYRGDVPLTTLVYLEYGNTSLYWLVMEYNGIVHPLEIQPGTVIEMPSLVDVDRFRSRTNSEDRRGEKVIL